MLLIFLGPGLSSGFEGTEIWMEGDGIEYAVDVYSGSDENPLYDLVDYQYWVEYQGMEDGYMKFLHYVDRVFIAEWFFGGYAGDMHYVDPSTGFDNTSRQSFMFFDTQSWVIGMPLGFNFTHSFSEDNKITAEYHVLTDKMTTTLANREIDYWVIGFDDLEHTVGTTKYVFKDYRVLVTDSGGVMIGRTENLFTYSDLNDDDQFTEDEQGYRLNIDFTLNNIDSNLESNFLPSSEPISSTESSNMNDSPYHGIFVIYGFLVVIYILKSKSNSRYP